MIDALERLPEQELVKARGLSFESTNDLLLHTVMEEDTWLHYRLRPYR